MKKLISQKVIPAILVAIHGILKSSSLLLLISCSLNTSHAPQYIFTTPSEVLVKSTPTEFFVAEEVYGTLKESSNRLRMDSKVGSFDYYTFLTNEKELVLEVKSYLDSFSFNKEIFIPTFQVLAKNGKEMKVKNIFYYYDDSLSQSKPHIHAKWKIYFEGHGQYYFILASDMTKGSDEIQSGLTDYYHPVYFNFSKKLKVAPYGEYYFKLDAQ